MTDRLAALLVIIAGGAYLAAALPLPRGVAARPGPGFYPMLVGVVFCIAGLAFIVETFRRVPPRASPDPITAAARIRALATAGTLIAFVVVLPWVGYVAATFFFVAAMLRALGGGWTLALATAIASAAASYWLFASLLAVPLPKGVFFD
jgi:hypothetical protein